MSTFLAASRIFSTRSLPFGYRAVPGRFSDSLVFFIAVSDHPLRTSILHYGSSIRRSGPHPRPQDQPYPSRRHGQHEYREEEIRAVAIAASDQLHDAERSGQIHRDDHECNGNRRSRAARHDFTSFGETSGEPLVEAVEQSDAGLEEGAQDHDS